MALGKHLIAAGIAATVLVTSVSAGATTYISQTLTGTNAETGYKKLGAGKRYLDGDGLSGTGTASAMKIVSLWPDSQVASISLKKGESASSSFTSVATSDGGDNQSYYIKWSGNSSTAKATVSITN